MDANTQPSSLSMSDVIRRTALPFFLFSVVLTGLLLISWYALIPELTSVEIAGQKRGLKEIRAYRDDLVSQIETIEANRDEFLMPVQDPIFVGLRAKKQEVPEFMGLRSDIGRVAQSMHPEMDGAVAISLFAVDIDAKQAKVNGEVRNVGPRSMTVLAEFIDEVRELPGIGEVDTSKYTRKEHPERGFFSPFSLAISLNE
jgi:hypothetical protein